MARKKEGLELLQAKQDPLPIEKITMLDWYAAQAIKHVQLSEMERSAKLVFDFAEACLNERAKRIGND